ncbi:MAG TPA: potassium channel family protein [Deinococcales bacterium]|nr:potassium channel family protein [Deinococcales bacterium]
MAPDRRTPTAARPGAAPRRRLARLAFGILRVPEEPALLAVGRRIALAIAIVLAVTALLWFTREGLRDNVHPDRDLTLVDVFYFTVVSLATVGYGDISPITPTARLINGLFLTPIRIILWVIFLGTAYELTVLRFRERVQMKRLHGRLNRHTIVCGYGVKGRAIVAELLAHGHAREDIIVIDPGPDAVECAVNDDLVSLKGDASSESLLRAAAVDRAEHVMVASNRDDASVLICLTARNLAPDVRIVAAAREEENVKLLYQAGADVVVSPGVTGGRVMAAAVRQTAVPAFLEDLLAFGRGVDAAEHSVTPAEAGRLVADLPHLQGTLPLGVMRGRQRHSFQELGGLRLQAGDVVVYLVGNPEPHEGHVR